MKIHFARNLGIVLMLAPVLLTGCGAPVPVEFGGNWVPVNRFQDKPQEIPLSPTYTYYPSPLDGTLRGMLRRWANDNAMPLVWQLGSDYTLYKAVADLSTNNLQTAIGQLNKIYAAQGVFITADPERILVQPASAAHALSSKTNGSRKRSARLADTPASVPTPSGH
jgi:hypothetical protein